MTPIFIVTVKLKCVICPESTSFTVTGYTYWETWQCPRCLSVYDVSIYADGSKGCNLVHAGDKPKIAHPVQTEFDLEE